MFVRITFWLVLCLFISDIAQPGYMKFWQPDLLKLFITDIRLPSVNINNNTTAIPPSETPTCLPPDNDLEEVIQAKIGCNDATPY